MRYTKIALLVFGCGLVLGLVVVAVEVKWLQRPASGLMALGIAAIPIGMITDWRRVMMTAKPGSKSRAKGPSRRTVPPVRRSARPKR